MSERISVVMPVYNSAYFLKESVESVLKQTYKDFEFIIIDDQSNDDSLGVIKEYAAKDERIRIIENKKNLGVTKSLNKGIKASKGRIIVRMDADDICSKNRFSEQLKKMQEGFDVVGSNIEIINDKGEKIGARTYSEDIHSVIVFESPLAHPSVMVRKELFDNFGLYDERFTSGQDYDRWLCFWSNKARFGLVQKNLLKYRVHKQSVKERRTKQTIRNTLLIKKHAKKEYGISFGLLGNLRILLERLLLLLPSWLIVKLFYSFRKVFS